MFRLRRSGELIVTFRRKKGDGGGEGERRRGRGKGRCGEGGGRGEGIGGGAEEGGGVVGIKSLCTCIRQCCDY